MAAISMNCDNHIVIININSSMDNMKSTSYKEAFEVYQEIEKLRSNSVELCPYV
jgi:hypothetical protein